MRAIINGKRYDTEAANEVASWWNGYSTSDFKYCREALYQTKNGSFFVHGEGGAMSKYSKPVGNATGGGEVIKPLTKEQAKCWLEDTNNFDELERLFGDQIEDA